MSWSIYLSGPKESVIAELRNAATVLRNALDIAEDARNEHLAISASGHGYVGGDGSFSIANSLTAEGIPPPQAVVVQEKVAEDTSVVATKIPDYPF